MTIIHCLLHYVDMTTATQTINGDLLRTVAKLVESPHWKESLRILKLAVTRSSTLVAPPSTGAMSYHWETTSASNFAEADMYFKKELPGRTMEFTFDLSQTPVIARKQIRPNMVVPPPSSASTSAASSGIIFLFVYISNISCRCWFSNLISRSLLFFLKIFSLWFLFSSFNSHLDICYASSS